MKTVFALRPGLGAAWTSVAPLPTPRAFLDAATGADGRIYVVGGYDFGAYHYGSNVLEIYDPATNQWTTGAPMPTPRYGLGVARGGDGRIYAIGGCHGALNYNVVEAYSPITNSWTTVAPLPTRRDGVLATESNSGLIYAIGSRDFRGRFTKRVDVYSPQQNKWWRVPNTQADHILGAAATATRRVFAIGGESTTAVESRPSFCAICK